MEHRLDIAALKNCDAREWEKAWRTLWPIAYGTAARYLLADKELAEDVAIESLKLLHQDIQSVENEEHLAARLTTIARHRSLTEIQRMFAQKRDRAKEDPLEDWELEIAAGDVPDAGALMDRKALTKDLGDSLDLLGNPCRFLLRAHFWEQTSSTQLAADLEEKVETVRVWISRCLGKLRKVLMRNPLLLKRLKAHLR